jgi:hypothetical protein
MNVAIGGPWIWQRDKRAFLLARIGRRRDRIPSDPTYNLCEEVAVQKLVTIYLHNSAYGKGKLVIGSYADEHGLIAEHLRDDLKDGWAVKAVHGFGGNSDGLSVRGWLAVLLEKSSADEDNRAGGD